MKLKWKDFDTEKDACLEEWMNKEYSENSLSIKKYAGWILDFGIVDAVGYFKRRMLNPELKKSMPDFAKVVCHNGESVAVVYIRCAAIDWDNKVFIACINPIIVNPRLVGKGYGTAVLKDLVLNSKKITGINVAKIGANVYQTNERSVRMFRHLGFNERLTERGVCIDFEKEVVKQFVKFKDKKKLFAFELIKNKGKDRHL